MIASQYQHTFKIYKRTLVDSTGFGKGNKGVFELQYYDYPDTAGFFKACLISKEPDKLFNYFKDTNKNIILYLKQIIIKQVLKLNPVLTFINISSIEMGSSQVMLTAKFSLL